MSKIVNTRANTSSATSPKGAVGLKVVCRLVGGALPLVVVGRVDLPALRDGEAGVVPVKW